MPTFPVPLFAAAVLAVLALHLALRQDRSGWLALLVALCAGQSLLLSLVQHYGLSALRPVQPITAAAIPGVAFVCFTHSALRPLDARDAVHALAPALAVICLLAFPDLLDLLVPLLYALYGVTIIRLARSNADALPLVRLENGDLSGRVWSVIGIALIASALSDILIVAAWLSGFAALQPWIISFASTATLLLLGWIALTPGLAPPEQTGDQPDQAAGAALHDPPDNAADAAADAAIVERLGALLDDSQLYLDPDLTLDRLARRMGLPRKTLSAAINRVTGENVSRLINTRRIDHACAQLASGRSVTETWLASGFNTKSNFNREFSRLRGTAPSAWQAAEQKKPRG